MESEESNEVGIKDVSGKRKRTPNHCKGIKNDSNQFANKKVTKSQELTTFNEVISRRELARMVILHNYPLNMVEHFGFRRFIASLQPGFHMISRNTLKDDILKIYEVVGDKCYEMLNKKCRIAITVDMWTSNNKKKGFMAVSGHYIDDSWVLQSCILRLIHVPDPHNVEALLLHLVEALMYMNVYHKLSTITIANSTTNDAMLSGLLERFPKKHMLLDGKVLHMHCYAHILNSIAKDVLGVINGAIERIRDSVVYWTASSDRIETFINCAYLMNNTKPKKLSLDCKTRWDSTYLMLETAIVYKDVFSRLKLLEENYEDVPFDEDWINVTEICGKLKCFYEVAEKFSRNLYPTSNFYLQNICDIKLTLNEWVKSPNVMIQDMEKKVLEKYDKYLDNCLIVIGVAAVLDPRYKLELVEFFFSKVYGENSQSKIDQIRHSCYELLSEYKSRAAKMSGNSSITRVTLGRTGTSKDTFEDKFEQFVASRYAAKTSSTYELDGYLEENVLPRTEDFDVLSWWKTNGVIYPNLQSMARDILAIRISTCTSRAPYSTNERLLRPNLDRLQPSTVEALMCCRRWLYKGSNGSSSTFDEEEEEEEEEEDVN